mmetsp:Transcript_27082/g.54105  ORF Transcript_27082/g.54105 Transcript_27082/m.54105 type:complete len:455 (-) Transcript_27082:3237-4601(-)
MSRATQRGSGRRYNTVIFNDGEIVHRQNKKSTLLEGTADEQPQQGNDADVKVKEENKYVFDFSADFNGAFGLMEKDEAGSMGVKKIQTTTPSKVASPSNHSSPRSVIFPSIYDTPTKQQQRQSAMFRAKKCTEAMGLSLTSFNSNVITRKPISLEGYSIGDKAELNDLLSLDISRENAALEAKSLEVGDAAFILRSDYNWTYAVVIDKAVVPDGQSSLRLEVGADKSRKTFFEAQWGKYVRVIKTTSRAVPGLSYSESRSDKANQDAVDNTNLARPKPKGILRNKENNPSRKLVERSRSKGNVGHRVQFVQSNTMYYDAESKIFAGRKEDSVMQTPTQRELLTTVCYKKNEAKKKKKKNRKKKGLERPELATTSSSSECASTQAKTDVKESESWDVRQLLSKLAQPVFPWRPTYSADKDDAITSEKDIVEESLTIECELRDDEKFHEIHILTSM